MARAWVLMAALLASGCERRSYSERLRSEAAEHRKAGRAEAEQRALALALDFDPADRLALEALLRSCVKSGCPAREGRVFSAVFEQPGLTTLDSLVLRLRLRSDCLECGLDAARAASEAARLTAIEGLIEDQDWNRVSLMLGIGRRSEQVLALRRRVLERMQALEVAASDAVLERLSESPTDAPSYFARLEWLLRTGREGEALRLEAPEWLRRSEAWPEWELRWARYYVSRSDWNAVLGWTEHPARTARDEARRQAFRTVAWLGRPDRKAARAQLRDWQRSSEAFGAWQSTLFLAELVPYRDSLLLLREELGTR